MGGVHDVCVEIRAHRLEVGPFSLDVEHTVARVMCVTYSRHVCLSFEGMFFDVCFWFWGPRPQNRVKSVMVYGLCTVTKNAPPCYQKTTAIKIETVILVPENTF